MCLESVGRFIGSEAAKTVIALATTSLIGLLGYLATLRYKSRALRTLLSDSARSFILHFRGEDNPDKTKTLKFQQDGKIVNTPDHNENRWKVSYGLLRIYDRSGKIYSRFKWDRKQGRLISTNAPNLPSYKGQYIVPSFIPYTEE